MSLRGFKKDIAITKKIKFKDKRSFYSLDRHFLLFGEDKSRQRHWIFVRCNPENIPEDEGEWDHLRNEHNNFRRCDCLEGGRFIRPKAHRLKHAKPMWTRRQA